MPTSSAHSAADTSPAVADRVEHQLAGLGAEPLRQRLRDRGGRRIAAEQRVDQRLVGAAAADASASARAANASSLACNWANSNGLIR